MSDHPRNGYVLLADSHRRPLSPLFGLWWGCVLVSQVVQSYSE